MIPGLLGSFEIPIGYLKINRSRTIFRMVNFFLQMAYICPPGYFLEGNNSRLIRRWLLAWIF